MQLLIAGLRPDDNNIFTVPERVYKARSYPTDLVNYDYFDRAIKEKRWEDLARSIVATMWQRNEPVEAADIYLVNITSFGYGVQCFRLTRTDEPSNVINFPAHPTVQ